MAYEINLNKGGQKSKRISSNRLNTSQQSYGTNIPHNRFYELEIAEVIDIIYNDEHEDFPKDDKDYSYIETWSKAIHGYMYIENSKISVYDTQYHKAVLDNIKNTQENIRAEELPGHTPTNLMMFGTPTKLLEFITLQLSYHVFLNQ